METTAVKRPARQIELNCRRDDRDKPIDTRMPPMIAMASGRSIKEPEPMASASGSIPATAASAVIRFRRTSPAPYRLEQVGKLIPLWLPPW